LVGPLAETVLGEDVRRAAERVGRDDIGAGVQIGRVDAADHVRAREVQVLVAALVRGATEVCGGEARRLDHGAHGAVEDEDALPERVAKGGRRGIGTYMTMRDPSLGGTLDVKSAEGVEVLTTLASRSDVLIENFRTGTMESFGLGYETLAAVNPRLIYCSISAFGRTGPRADGAGYEALMQAFSGIM